MRKEICVPDELEECDTAHRALGGLEAPEDIEVETVSLAAIGAAVHIVADKQDDRQYELEVRTRAQLLHH